MYGGEIDFKKFTRKYGVRVVGMIFFLCVRTICKGFPLFNTIFCTPSVPPNPESDFKRTRVMYTNLLSGWKQQKTRFKRRSYVILVYYIYFFLLRPVKRDRRGRSNIKIGRSRQRKRVFAYVRTYNVFGAEFIINIDASRAAVAVNVNLL